jgi:hypothetical protein
LNGWQEPIEEPGFNAAYQWRIKPELFEGKFILFEDGTWATATRELTDLEIAKGRRIITLREVEEK